MYEFTADTRSTPAQVVPTTRCRCKRSASAMRTFVDKEFDVSVRVSQLHRGPGQRIDKRPKLSGFCESGAIEQGW